MPLGARLAAAGLARLLNETAHDVVHHGDVDPLLPRAGLYHVGHEPLALIHGQLVQVQVVGAFAAGDFAVHR